MTATAPDRPGPLARARLHDPCRLYVYGWALLLLLAGAATAVFTGHWHLFAMQAATLLLLVPGVEAAKRSMFGPAEVVRAIQRARDTW
jgi:hypothetical protein